MTDAETHRIESLIAETDWLRRLARSLVPDAASADDAVQETLATAVRRPPRHLDSPRGWLATVLRNVVRQSGRAGGSRTRRERAVSRREAVEDVAVAAERVELQRRLAALVLELPKDARNVILLRYYEGHSLAEIARRLDEPASTIRNRHHRAVAELRRRLDEEHSGGRRAWTALLFTYFLKEGVAMTARVKIAVAAVVLALVAGGIWFSTVDRDATPDRVPAVVDVPLPVAPTDEEEEEPAVAARDPEAGDVAGTVRDEKDAPIPGAFVRILTPAEHLPSTTALDETRTDGAGRYVMGPLSEKVILEASAEGRETLRREARPDQRQDFVLRKAGVVSGTVRFAATGQPCNDAVVTLRIVHEYGITPKDRTSSQRTGRTDPDGGFRIAGVAAGLYDIAVHPASAPVLRRKDVWIPATGKPGLLFEIAPGVRLTGRVYDKVSGTGVPGVTVRVMDAPRLRAVSGTDGTYVVTGFPQGTIFTPGGWHNQYVEIDLPFAAGYVKPSRLDLRPDPGGGDVALDIPLEKGGGVEGVVVDPDGKPVAGALVTYHLFNVSGAHDQVVAPSREDGSFSLTGIPPAHWPLYAMKEGFATIETSRVPIKAGEVTKGVVVPLAAGVSVSGVVVDEAGAPVVDAQVYFRQVDAVRYGDGTLNAPMQRSDSRGAFRFPCAPPGDAWLDVRAPDLRAASSGEFRVEIGKPVERLRVEMPIGATLQGRVVDQSGAPVVGLRLSLYRKGPKLTRHPRKAGPWTSGGVRTDGDGRFVRRGLIDGNWQIRVPGAAPVDWIPGNGPVEIRVGALPTGEITGTVVLADGGPPGYVEVRARPETKGVRAHSAWTGRPETGFVLASLPDGQYSVQAAGGAGLFSPSQSVVVANGRQDRPLRLVLRAGGTVGGKVTGLDGRPCRHVDVRYSRVGGTDDPVKASGRGGAFQIGPLDAGRWRIELKSGRSTAVGEVDVEAGKEARLDLELDCGRALRVTAVDGSGSPVSEAVVTIRDAAGKEFRLDTPRHREWHRMEEGGDGGKSFDEWEARHRSTGRNGPGTVIVYDIPPGAYSLEIVAPYGRRASAKATVKEETLARVKVTVK